MPREPAAERGLGGAEAASIFGMPPRIPFAHGSLAAACAASIFGMPPSRPPVGIDGKLSGGGAGVVEGNCPNELGKIGGAQARAPTRLAGISDQ